MLSALLLLFYFHLGNSYILLSHLEFCIALCHHNMPFHTCSLVHFTVDSEKWGTTITSTGGPFDSVSNSRFPESVPHFNVFVPLGSHRILPGAMIFNVSATYCRLLSPQPVHSGDGGVVLNFLWIWEQIYFLELKWE